jgi:hypothetical protein
MYAKGAPLCLDFGNCYQPVQRNESIYHNMVSFGAPGTPGTVGTGHLITSQSLPAVLEYSQGVSDGGGGQHDNRHLLMVESADPMGANYLVVRDHTTDGQPNQQFAYNLWCLSKEPQINGNVVHFPGQFDVDLDVHLLSPAQPKITTDHWGWSEQIYVWGQFEEEQYGIHVGKIGSHEDFLSVLNPRGTGQAAAEVTTLAGGAALKVHHSEGDDLVLLSPDAASTAADNGLQVSGKIALARRYTDGRLRLATMSGPGQAAAAGFVLASDGGTAVDIKPGTIAGQSSGEAHNATLTLPATYGQVTVKIDGAAVKMNRDGDVITLSLPAGYHTFTLDHTP